VSFQYPGARHGVDDVTLSAAQGELLAVMGRSGSGKSTLLRLAAGLLDGWRGRIAIGGDDVAGVPVWRREVGMVFQHYALFPNLSVVDNVAYGLVNRKMKRDAIHERVHTLLALVGLPDSHRKHPGQLSGGQQQRIALARALATSPGLLLLDEPFQGIDAGARADIVDMLRRHAHERATLVFVSDLEEAAEVADRVVRFDRATLDHSSSHPSD
ncbi:ATP-binding cassette domain-containing protein, partial [Ralstonia pickettii]|nr:ATP-binding cassette domain-containing protein [Ralstonia pickettii]